MIERYFLDTDCNRIEYKDAYAHDELAAKIIEDNPNLKAEYSRVKDSGLVSESVFLVMKGYIYAGGNESQTSVMFSSISLNSKTKSYLSMLKDNDAYVYDIIRNELSDDQKALVKSWYNEDIDLNTIQFRVMTEMLSVITRNKNNEKEIEDR